MTIITDGLLDAAERVGFGRGTLRDYQHMDDAGYPTVHYTRIKDTMTQVDFAATIPLSIATDMMKLDARQLMNLNVHIVDLDAGEHGKFKINMHVNGAAIWITSPKGESYQVSYTDLWKAAVSAVIEHETPKPQAREIEDIPTTRDEWKDLARVTIPALTEYGIECGRSWDENKASELFDKGHYTDLHMMFHEFWDSLPNHPGIRFGPFFRLCNLCSEAHCILPEPDDAKTHG